jgi:hypothetical protein
MKQHVDMETDEPKSRAMITEGINAMLKCLLSKDEMNCKKCKTCCFLMESVFVYQYHKKRKDNSAL